MFFPSLLDAEVQHDLPAVLRPTRHNRPGECVLDAELLPLLLSDQGR
ncbi:MAG: hypothetical protein ACI8S6_001049 [Myxococcota bacterium]